MAKPSLSIALSHYDRHVPFFDGTARPDGIDLYILIVGQSDRQRDGEDRHERMLQHSSSVPAADCPWHGQEPRYAVYRDSRVPAPLVQSFTNVGERGCGGSLAA